MDRMMNPVSNLPSAIKIHEYENAELLLLDCNTICLVLGA